MKALRNKVQCYRAVLKAVLEKEILSEEMRGDILRKVQKWDPEFQYSA
jgi:hypothetical protein